MATFVKTPSGTWKALIRRQGWPATIKTFRTKRDAEDWARRTEDEMVRGVFIRRTTHERTTVADALDRYEREVVPLKKASTQAREGARIREVKAFFGKYTLAAVSPHLLAECRDKRLALGKANNTTRLELALLGHMFSTAIKEWHMGLTYNPASNVRKPSFGQSRNRLVGDEQERSRLLHRLPDDARGRLRVLDSVLAGLLAQRRVYECHARQLQPGVHARRQPS